MTFNSYSVVAIKADLLHLKKYFYATEIWSFFKNQAPNSLMQLMQPYRHDSQSVPLFKEVYEIYPYWYS